MVKIPLTKIKEQKVLYENDIYNFANSIPAVIIDFKDHMHMQFGVVYIRYIDAECIFKKPVNGYKEGYIMNYFV